MVAQVNEAGLPVVLPNAEGSPTTPSVVLFDAGQAVVGAVARESLATEPESVVQLVKRHIGSGWTFDYGGVCYRPEHISALILRRLAQDAQLLAGPALVYQQGAWSEASKIDGNNAFTAVSCVRVDTCTAADQYDNVTYYARSPAG